MPFFSRSDRPDSAPRRRREDGDRDGRLSFEVETLEFVPAGDGLGLLRLSGTWSADPERLVPAPVEMEIERDGESVRVPVLPDPSMPEAVAMPRGEHWRGAFMADAELAQDPRSDFALVAGDEVIAGLPRPGDIGLDEGYVDTADEDEPPAAEAADELSDHDGDEPPALSKLLAELERVASVDEAVRPLEIEQDDVVAEHEAARAAAAARAETAESTVESLRHELESLRGVTDAAEATLAELRQNADRERSAREDAEAATALAHEGTEAERTAREQAEATLEELRSQMERDRAGRENQQEALTELRADVERERAGREAAEGKLSEALATLDRERKRHLAAEAETRGEIAAARRELDDARLQVEEARSEAEDARSATDEAHRQVEEARREADEARGNADEARRQLDDARREVKSAGTGDERAAWERERADLLAQIDALRLDGDRQREHERKAEENERKLTTVHEHLDQARKELDLERRRGSTMEEELRMQVSIERQLRDALAGQEADLAAATADVARREGIAERRGDEPGERGDSRPHEVKGDFFARIEHAKRLSESSGAQSP
jgi:chromosome segregation ATPase